MDFWRYTVLWYLAFGMEGYDTQGKHDGSVAYVEAAGTDKAKDGP